MSEVINQVAVLTAKPEGFDELVAEIANITRNVQEHEPETTVYYAYSIAQTNEIVVVERYANQAALDKHHAAPYFQELVKKAPALLAKPFDLKVGSHLLQDSAQVVRL
ncbi:Dimeric alpha-beta barrel [Penicillium italicum]|uniref:Dimeric alpha-beta barrel n=1 Tax=Penicillium italicum TaxID=40296 RepID=A0A0A2KJV2_PENIT|nr:Dimeric alpha-beta barrel [Penicillium italicum]